jgi:hypothetical protein
MERRRKARPGDSSASPPSPAAAYNTGNGKFVHAFTRVDAGIVKFSYFAYLLMLPFLDLLAAWLKGIP